MSRQMKIVLFANTEWYLYNFRRSLALALRDAGHEVLLLSPDGPYGEKLLALGLRWQPVPMDRRSLNPLRESLLLAHLVRLLRRERPDIVHGFTIKSAVYGSLAARLAGIRARVNAVAGMGYVFTSDEPKARLLRPLVRILLKLAMDGGKARLILQNPDDAALFEHARLVDPSRIRLIPGSGVDTARFYPDPERGRRTQVRVLLPARLLWDKGVAEYAQAARLLHEQNKPVEMLLAGDPDPGNPAAVPEAEVKAWEQKGWLHWLGHVDDMPALLRSVDVVALPTSYGEGLPKSLIEAAACGCALIATDVPGCREVVTHEADGLLVPVRDGAALAAAIARLQEDAAFRMRLAVAGMRKTLERFDERIVIRDTFAVYDELVVPS